MTTVAIIGAGPLGRWLALAASRAGFRVFLEDVMPSNLHHAQEYLRKQLSAGSVAGLDQDFSLGNNGQGAAEKGRTSGWMAEGAKQGLKPNALNSAGGGPAEAVPLLQSVHPTRSSAAGSDSEVHSERVSFVSTVEDAVREADLVIDCVPDELESKLEILWLLDRMAPPRTVIATPTAHLSIADLASCTYRPEKCIAIAASPRTLSDERPGSTIRLQVTPRTMPETVTLVQSFWQRLGFHAVIEQASD